MTRKLSGNIKCLVLSLLILAGFGTTLLAQSKISGVINKYGRVTSIGVDFVIVEDETQFAQFAPGDTVLLIQMKGVRIYTPESTSYGNSGFSYGQAGRHEFLTVLSVDPVTNTILFRNNIVNASFSIEGDIQIIKVPSYNWAVVNATLTCQPWDSTTKTGGVLAAIVGRTLSLNANIDVSGKGFKGGATATGQGICMSTDPKWEEYAYSALSDSAGYKGEGLAIKADPSGIGIPPFLSLFPQYAKGQGKNFNGGGGGNGRFSGGGGGSNYGAGGKGGNETGTCSPAKAGGLGGIQIAGLGLDGGLFLGGGGGASTWQLAGSPTAGANGGGLVILVCDTIKGKGRAILADGATPSGTASGNAGAGGGGGGGSIALYLQSYSTDIDSSALTIRAAGGNGGNNTGTFGEGGGGGGGYVALNSTPRPGNVPLPSVVGGLVGTRAGLPTGGAGITGKNISSFVPLLNGFLFNSIRSSVTGNQIDSICSNVTPLPVTGTTPVGGSGNYSYVWERSYNLLAEPSIVPTAISKDYAPAAPEINTHWLRRIVRDNITSLTDTSKWVQIIVQPAITGNLVGKDTTICYNQDPLSLIPLNSGPSNGNGRYAYRWLENASDLNWTASPAASGTYDLDSYDPPSLGVTTYYKRMVTSGRCIDYSSTITVTVLPLITGNTIITPDEIICEGSLFSTINAASVVGGDGSYTYQWQDSTVSGSWLPASGINNNTTHDADTSQFAVTEQRFFRRVVLSGPYDVCRSNSPPVLLTRYHKISDNVIGSDQTICSGSTPLELNELFSVTGGAGTGTYTYQWQDSSKADTWSTRGTAGNSYAPASLADTTWYRRIVISSVCTDISNKIVINVHKPILNNIVNLISGPGPDTTICSGATPNTIKGMVPAGGTDLPGDYAYQWSFSTDNVNFSDITTSGNAIDYQPEPLTETTWFRRNVISGLCSAVSNSIQIIVLPQISDNIITPGKATVCFNTLPVPISGTSLTGGAGGTPIWIWEQSLNGVDWVPAEGAGSNQNYSPPVLTVRTWYRRIILSGPAECCIDTSNVVAIDIDPLPTGTIISVSDTTICSGGEVELKIQLTGATGWNIIYNENSTPLTVNGISDAQPTIRRIPSPSGSMSTFNYTLASVTDNNGCSAILLTGSRSADVYRNPVAEAGPADDVCGPDYTLAAVPTVGTGIWTFPPQVIESAPGLYNSEIRIEPIATASVAYKFYWEETNWQCKSKDSVIITFYKEIAPVDAGEGGPVMTFDNILGVNASPLQTYETGKWSVVAGTGNFEDDSESSTYIRDISQGLNTYKWTVTNGACMTEDIITFEVSQPLIPEGLSPDGNGINDSLVISGLDLINQNVEIIVLNGAGNLVFSASNSDGSSWQNWDGKNSKGAELPEGTYYYLLKVSSRKTGLAVQKSGFVILKRN